MEENAKDKENILVDRIKSSSHLLDNDGEEDDRWLIVDVRLIRLTANIIQYNTINV